LLLEVTRGLGRNNNRVKELEGRDKMKFKNLPLVTTSKFKGLRRFLISPE